MASTRDNAEVLDHRFDEAGSGKTRGKGSAKNRLRLNKSGMPDSLLGMTMSADSPLKSQLKSLSTAVDCAEQLCAIKSISKWKSKVRVKAFGF